MDPMTGSTRSRGTPRSAARRLFGVVKASILRRRDPPERPGSLFGRPPRNRGFMRRFARSVILLALFAASGCAYYNTFFHARQFYKDAESARARSRSRGAARFDRARSLRTVDEEVREGDPRVSRLEVGRRRGAADGQVHVREGGPSRRGPQVRRGRDDLRRTARFSIEARFFKSRRRFSNWNAIVTR